MEVYSEHILLYDQQCSKEKCSYIDYEKAFDHVDWTKLMMILQVVDWRGRKLIWYICNKQRAYVRIGDGLSTACTNGIGVT